MFWKKKIGEPRKEEPTVIERAIIDYVASTLSNNYGKILSEQIKYLKLIKRIEYSQDVATEFYPEKFDSIPDAILFEKREEFCFGSVKFKINSQNYLSKIYFVLGSLFEIRIKPKPPKSDGLQLSDIEFVSLNSRENLY